jgi:hypothetical protein
MPGNDVDFITFNLTAQLDWLFLTAISSRNCVVIACTSSLSNSSSAGVC